MNSGSILQFPLAHGLGEDGNPKAKPVATLKRGENIRWPKDGVIGKRYGTSLMTGVSTPRRFVIRGNELGIIDGTTMRVQNGDGSWRTVCQVSDVGLTWSTLIDSEMGVATCAVQVFDDFIVSAWVTGDPTRSQEATPVPVEHGFAFFQVTALISNEVIIPPTRLDGPPASNPQVTWVKILTSGDTVYILSGCKDDNLRCQAVNPVTQVISSAQVLVNNLKSDSATVYGRFDAIILASGNMAIAYEAGGSVTGRLTAARFTLSGTTWSLAVSANLPTTENDIYSLAMCEDAAASRVYITFSQTYSGGGYAARTRIRAVSNSTMASALAAVDIQDGFAASQIGVRLISTGRVLVGWSGFDLTASTAQEFNTAVFDATGTIVAQTRRRSKGIQLLSGFGSVGGRLYVLAADAQWAARYGYGAAIDQPRPPGIGTYVLGIETAVAGAISNDVSHTFPPHRYVGKIDHDVGGMFQEGVTPALTSSGPDTLYAVCPFQADAAQVSWNWRDGVRLVQITDDAALLPDQWRSASVNQEAYIAGGVLGAWDGRLVFDYGMRPIREFFIAPANANTGRMANGNYLYQLEPTFRSRVGVLHRGPLSPVLEVTAAANGSVTVKIGDASIDCKQDNNTGYASNSALNVEFPLFRSEANGSVLYQLTMEPRYNRIPNDPCAAYLNFTDVSPDSTIAAFYPAVDIPTVPNLPLASRPQPYTASGELEDCQPPAQYTMLFYAGRLFLVTGGRREIWFSKDIKENGSDIAPGFNPEMVEVYDQDITALAALDDKRVIFWARGIWYVVGDGPTVAGTDNRFSTPQAIQSAVGCTNPRSVVTTPAGVIFQCGTDLYLLTRALEIEWIGRDARETLAAFPNITSAVLVARDGEVRFTCNNSGNTSGIILVFDYRRNTWSTRTYPESVSIQDAVVYNGTYFFATTAGLRFENPNIHLDDSVTFVDSTVELEPITPAGVPISWSRVRIAKLLGESLSNHRLDVSFSRDWADTYEQTETFLAGSAPTTPGAHARAEILLTVQRREAVGIKFVDSAPANATAYPLGNGAGFQFEGVGLLVIPKQGLPRDTSDRRGG